ncbi:hypothetical protein [Bhargavaea cecembensis]|uniref:hypothetical protein n=1 Tax=Bhargavaea cecembensis TaxID=394098 RepID=UPI0012E90D11|nr:hypothetical protein [Bhargavaea cecembensis]
MTSNYGQWLGEYDDVKWHVGPDNSIPYESGRFERGQSSMYEEQPGLFGENQLRDHMGPVYAVPPFPQHGPGSEESGWQQQWSDEHPALYNQGHMGPVYAVPHFPWQQGDSYGAGSGQGHQYGHYPQMPMPCCSHCGYSPWQGFQY